VDLCGALEYVVGQGRRDDLTTQERVDNIAMTLKRVA
jgi:hypothetical protein